MNGPQVVTGNEVKKKKRKTISLDMYMGSSGTEETTKRKKHKRNSETQQAVADSPTPKRTKTGDAYIEEWTDQEYKEISAQKKKRKEESLQKADDVIVIESSSAALHREANEEVKISHRSKDNKRLQGDDGFTEGAIYKELTDLKGRTKKKKKKLKKESGERILENSLVEELFTPETQHATGKKKKRNGGGGLQEEDDKSNLQCGITEELISERKYPDRSETPEQVDESVRKKKKKKRKDESQEADDITVNDAKIKKSHEAKDLNLHLHGIPLLEAKCRESANIEYRPSLKKKPKKYHREHVLEDNLVDELLISEIQHTSKKKRKGCGDESHRQDCFTGELVTQRKHQDGSETIKKVHESVDRAEDNFVEQLLIPETQHAYKEKRKRGGSYHKDDDESNLQHGFTEELIYERKYPDGSEIPEQVDESSRKKKKKKRKDDSQEVDDITVADAKIKKSCKARDLNGLHGDEGLSEDVLNREPADIGHRSSLKKKPKKDCRECILEDSLVQASLTPETQHTSKKKKKKRKGGDDESHRLDCFLGELVTKRNHQDGSETIEQVDESVDQAEGSLVEELLVPETQHAYKKKKKRKDGGGLQEDRATHALCSTKKCPEQVGESADRAEKHVKKKKRKDKPQQEADDTTVDAASYSVGLRGDEPSCSKLTDTENRLSRKKKKKSKKDHREHPLEEILVEESLTSNAQHTSKKTTKRKGGGGEIHRQLGLDEELVNYQGGSENTEQVDETIEQADVHVKKKKAKKKQHSNSRVEISEILATETHLEYDDASADSTEISQSSQSRRVENDGNVEGDVEEDTEQPSTTKRRRPETSAPTDADQNPATQDESETIHNKGNRSASSDKSTEKPYERQRRNALASIREEDVVLLKEYFPQMTEEKLSRLIICHELERIRIAKQNGIMFRSGHFTLDEDEQIKKNVQTFMLQVGIDSSELLFHPYKFPDMKRTIEELKRKFNFRQRIAEGLHRITYDVYQRGAKLHELNITKGRFSEQEVKLLKKYHEIYGNNWTLIGTLLNRGTNSSQLKASQIRRDVNIGKWSVEEINLLIAAVKQQVLDSLRKQRKNSKETVTVPKEMVYKGISWVRIEEKVETRNWTHCKRKWFELMLKRMNNFINPFNGLLGIQSTIKIIKWMRNSEVKEYGDVKWDQLSNFIGNVPPFLTQNKFFLMKKSIPEWKKLRLYEIVDRLYQEMLPELERKLFSAQESPIEPERKDEFLISEIFQEYSEYEENWNLLEYITKVGGGRGHCRVPS